MNTCSSGRRPQCDPRADTKLLIAAACGLSASLFLITPTAGLAQDIPRRLTLERAIQIAEEQSPDYRVASNRLDLAELDVRQAKMNSFLPMLDANLLSRGSAIRNFQTEDFFGLPLEEPFTERWWSTTTDQTLRISMPIFDMGNIRRLRGSRASYRSTEAGFDMETFRLRAEVARRYYAGLQADAAVELERQLVASAEENLERTRRLFEIVRRSHEELLGAELELISSQNSLEAATGEARKSRLTLLESLGVPGERELELVDELPQPFDPALLDAAALGTQAVGNSPRVRQAEMSARASEAQLGVAHADRWPTVSLNGVVARQRSTRDDHGAFFDVNPPNWGYNVSLSVRIPVGLFQLHSAPQRATAQIGYENAREELRAERIRLEREVNDALIDLEQAYRNIDLADRRVEIEAQRVELTEERMRAGGAGISVFELDQYRRAFADAERQALAARFNFQNLLFVLEEIVGRTIRP